MKIRNVQALRALAALLVIANHLPRQEARLFGTSGLLHGANAAGAIGVDLFFVISGFIMMVTTWNAFGREGAGPRFLLRRALRIYPFYWITLTLYLTISRLVPGALHLPAASAWDLITSYLLLPHASDPVLDLAWSLQFEMFFYLVFAGALWFARARLPLIVAGWAAVTLTLAAAAPFTTAVAVQFLGSPLSFEFLMGMAVGALARTGRLRAPVPALGLGVLGSAAAVWAATHYPDGFPTLTDVWTRALLFAPPFAVLLYGAVGMETLHGRIAPRWLVGLGDASYSLYLWHGFVLGTLTVLLVRLHPHGRAEDVLYVLAAWTGASLTAVAVYRLVERPLIRAFAGLGAAAPERGLVDDRAPAIAAQ